MVYQKGDLIVYGSSGVCRIEDIGPLKGAGGVNGRRSYYTLSLVFGSGVIYTPVDTNVFMRPVLSKERVEQLITQLPDLNEDVCSTSNLRQLTEHYHAAFETHSCEELLRLIKSVYQKDQDSLKQGKRLGLTDQKYRKHAEELVHGEFSVALGIPYEQVPGYISARITALDQGGASSVMPS